VVSLNAPKGRGGFYDEYEYEDVKIYVAKDIESHNNTLTVGLVKFLFFKNLRVDGVRIML